MGKFKKIPQTEPKPQPISVDTPSDTTEIKPDICLNDEGVYLMAESDTAKVFHHPIFGPIKVKK